MVVGVVTLAIGSALMVGALQRRIAGVGEAAFWRVRFLPWGVGCLAALCGIVLGTGLRRRSSLASVSGELVVSSVFLGRGPVGG